jgi:hypothetical protein
MLGVSFVDWRHGPGDSAERSLVWLAIDHLALRLQGGSVIDRERESRAAERRRKAVIRRVSLDDVTADPDTVHGTDAISLVTQLTRESWSLSGHPWPEYKRSEMPYRFVPGWPK